MSFYNQFLAHFSTEEQSSTLVQYYAMEGMNLESTLLTYISQQVAEMNDVNAFSSELSQSWLGFFLRKLPNRTSPSCTVTLTMDNAGALVNIPSGTLLNSASGQYIQQSAVSVLQGNTVTFTAKQGQSMTATGTYSSIIAIRGTNVDMSSLTLTMDSTAGMVTIPEVEYTTSYVDMEYLGTLTMDNSLVDGVGMKGQWYVVTQDGEYNFGSGVIDVHAGNWIVYDGDKWTLSFNKPDFNPYQLSNAYAKPYNGFYAYYNEGYLYIRVFPGDNVPVPDGLPYTLTYLSTNGIQGETGVNTLTYQSTITDIDGNPVEYTLTNTASTKGNNELTKSQLNGMLRQAFYATTSISSVPEYTAWFNAQPEVGDCYVYSDYEEYLRTGVQPATVSGYVSVMLLDNQGIMIQPSSSTAALLLNRIQPYKDVGYLLITAFTVVNNYLLFQYESSSDDTAFQALVKTVAQEYYSITSLKAAGGSLFDDLDLAAMLQTIQTRDQYSSVGLAVTGYHVVTTRWDETQTSAQVESYLGEELGAGYYIFSPYLFINGEQQFNEDGSYMYGTPIRFYETMSDLSYTTANIWYKASEIASPVAVGVHSSLTKQATFAFTAAGCPTIGPGKLECYWPSADKGLLSVGGINYQRALPSMTTGYNDTKGIEIEIYE